SHRQLGQLGTGGAPPHGDTVHPGVDEVVVGTAGTGIGHVESEDGGPQSGAERLHELIVLRDLLLDVDLAEGVAEARGVWEPPQPLAERGDLLLVTSERAGDRFVAEGHQDVLSVMLQDSVRSSNSSVASRSRRPIVVSASVTSRSPRRVKICRFTAEIPVGADWSEARNQSGSPAMSKGRSSIA